jgi:ATP-dependent DNA helicase RecG
MKLSDLKGIGPKRLALFSQLHIETPEDLLRFYPREYLDYSQTTKISSLTEGERASVFVKVLSEPSVFYTKGKYIVSVRVSDDTGKGTLRWMNQPYRRNQFRVGESFFANGIVSKKHGVVIYNPAIDRGCGGIQPIYASVKGLTQTVIRDAVFAALKNVSFRDLLPADWISRFGLMDLNAALREVHQPSTPQSLAAAKKRLSFDEAFYYFTAIRLAKDERSRHNGFSFRTEKTEETFLSTLSFKPTDAQLRVISEVCADMRAPRPMNRLIQGDVGSGKTLIAEYALSVSAVNGKQGVLLAPTEILAAQHFRKLQNRFDRICLYTGNLTLKEKRLLLEGIEAGDYDVIVGTHALLSDCVRFRDLGLVITDEQHRFGVVQRAKIEAKGIRPDVLVMSATPIPRTLALLLYADLDLSVIDQMPPGRAPIKTFLVPSQKRDDLYRHLAENAHRGELAYVVCPLIEPTDGYEGLSVTEIYDELRRLLPETKIAVLHGQMTEAEKDLVMRSFRSDETEILVSTTVIEVGVDVPEATSMVIEGAEHFGLATLHQLRGRVGRGSKQSFCYLLCRKLSDHSRQRIETMLETTDGFRIAQKDYDIRGMGDLFGVRQSGDAELHSILSGCTLETIEIASSAANEVFALPKTSYNLLMEEAFNRYGALREIARN